MRVLHYIRDIDGVTLNMPYSLMSIVLSTSKVTETHLLTFSQLSEERLQMLKEQYGVTVHALPCVKRIMPLRIYTENSKVRKVIREIRPDIVHIWGTWDMTGAIVERCARKERVVTIVSPLRGLATVNINTSFWKEKLPRLLAYQTVMVRSSTAVLALDDAERSDIISIKLKSHIETLPAEEAELQGAVMAAYRKALDSSYLNYITDEERAFVENAVRIAVVRDDDGSVLPENQGLSFRRIYLYAYDEDVTDLLTEGARKTERPMPPLLDVSKVRRYKSKKAKNRISLVDVDAKTRKIAIPADKEKEIKVVKMIAGAKRVTMKRMTMRQWVELYDMFRNIDFDEDMVAEELQHQHLKSFTVRIQRRLRDSYNLPQGYDIF